MGALATVEDDAEIFSASAYDLPIPKMDDRRATHLRITFSGAGELDRTSEDDLELLEAMRLGKEVRLIVTGTIAGKSFRLGASDEDLVYSCTLRVSSVEAGEIA